MGIDYTWTTHSTKTIKIPIISRLETEIVSCFWEKALYRARYICPGCISQVRCWFEGVEVAVVRCIVAKIDFRQELSYLSKTIWVSIEKGKFYTCIPDPS